MAITRKVKGGRRTTCARLPFTRPAVEGFVLAEAARISRAREVDGEEDTD